MNPKTPSSQIHRGALAAGITCYVIWGFIALLFQAIGRRGAGPWEILAHRALWSVPTCWLLVTLGGLWPQVRQVMRTPHALGWLALSAALIAINWITFIWAVNSGQVLQASFGYFITPLISMAGGALIFHERLSRWGALAIGVAVLGVAVQGVAVGGLPLVSLVLGLAFGGYGIVRKHIAADALTGLFVECVLIGGVGLIYVILVEHAGSGHFFDSPATAAWLIATGPTTALQLALYVWAARRIPLSFMGFMHFLSPAITMLVGLAEGEPLSGLGMAAFALIFLGAAIFSVDTWKRSAMSGVA